MGRLTKNDLNKVCYDPWEICGMDKHCTKGCHDEGGCTKGCHILKIHRKLAEYEDAEEQGQFLRLPCKVGDKVYIIRKCSCWNDYQYMDKNRLKCKEKTNIPSGKKKKTTCAYITEVKFELKHIAEIGKTVFFTREEAEQALAEMQKG